MSNGIDPFGGYDESVAIQQAQATLWPTLPILKEDFGGGATLPSFREPTPWYVQFSHTASDFVDTGIRAMKAAGSFVGTGFVKAGTNQTLPRRAANTFGGGVPILAPTNWILWILLALGGLLLLRVGARR